MSPSLLNTINDPEACEGYSGGRVGEELQMRQKEGRQRGLKRGTMDSQEQRRLEPIDELKNEKRRNDIQKMGSHLIFINARAKGEKESIHCIKRLHKRGQLEPIKDWDYFHPDEKELVKSLLSKKIRPKI